MTYQCMQCGSQTRAGAKFCHQCGTPIATTSLPPTMPFAAPPPTAETQPQAFEAAAAPRTAAATEAMPASTAYISQMPQTYQAPMPVPMLPQKSRSGFKIVMITLAIIFAFGIASVIGAAFFIKNQVQQNAQKIFKTNPASVPDDQLGVPPYPMAKRVSTKASAIGPYSGFVVEFITNDSIEKVADFYRAYFRSQDVNPAEVERTDDATGEHSIVFQSGGEGVGRVLTIASAGKMTKIVIISGSSMPPPRPRGGLPEPPPGMEPPPPPDAPPPPGEQPRHRR